MKTKTTNFEPSNTENIRNEAYPDAELSKKEEHTWFPEKDFDELNYLGITKKNSRMRNF